MGLGLAVGTYATLSFFALPVLLVYGVIRGLDQSTPDVILPQFLGALLGRFYFRKRFGEQWQQYIIVFFAGYMCGQGPDYDVRPGFGLHQQERDHLTLLSVPGCRSRLVAASLLQS